MARLLPLTLVLVAFVPTPLLGQVWVDVYNPAQVLTLNLEMDEHDWDIIRHDTTNEIEVPAMFWADGEDPISVSVRRKSSRALPSEGNPIKIGMKVDINEFVSGQLWHGVAKVSLENGADLGPIAEGLAWNFHELASIDGFYGIGYHAGLASWVRVVVNDEYIGLYISVEERDKQFLRNRNTFVNNRTWLYEIDDFGAGVYELEVGDPHSPTWNTLKYSPFQVGARKNPVDPTPSDDQLAVNLPNLIDMQVMLTQGAIDAFTQNKDALFTHGKNFRFADFQPTGAEGDPLAGLKRRYYMWDLDSGFANVSDLDSGFFNVSENIYSQKSRKGSFAPTEYQRVILQHPSFRQQYNDIMVGLLFGPLSESNLHAFLQTVQGAVTPALASDPYAGFASEAAVANHFNGLKRWIDQRRQSVLNQVIQNTPAPR